MALKGKRNYKFTRKKQSKRGISAFLLSLLSAVSFAVVIFLSFREDGKGSMYLGSAGVTSMVFSILALILAVISLREENSFKLFPYLATVSSFLTTGMWIVLYVAGM